ncbi:hypothetical protein [Streptomyces sp. NPDC051567]|uniref:hypothetical protein n=1 Tax=Streptomyces sp. NPDC051567 TaxID=3365660 RepID=UPI00379BBBE6
MTLQSDRPDGPDRARPADEAGRAEADRRAARITDLLRSTDPEAAWAFGGPDGVHAGSDTVRPGPGPTGKVFDVGGLAPVLALWPVIGSLVAQEALHLHTPLCGYGIEPSAGTPHGTTAHHLLTHNAGPAAHAALGALTRLAEHLGGSPFADLAADRIWRPLGLTGTRFADGTLHAPLADLARFLRHLLSPADHPVPRAWTAESLRIRTGELTPARGLLWDPAPHGLWTHHAPDGDGPAVWVSPRRGLWAVLLPDRPRAPLRTAFREAAFAPAAP